MATKIQVMKTPAIKPRTDGADLFTQSDLHRQVSFRWLDLLPPGLPIPVPRSLIRSDHINFKACAFLPSVS